MTGQSTRLAKTLLLAGAAMGALPTSASATETAENPNEIIVTAQRRAERLEDVPMSVAAVSGETLAKANINGMQDIAQIVPGVMITYNGLSSQPSIRGISSLTNGTGNENNVAVYIDGFYVTDNQSINQDLANIASMQVLKGPQGTLYGRNATGGAILIQTMDPTVDPAMKVDLSYAKFNEIKSSGYVSGQIVPGVRALVSGAYRKGDGWIRFSDPNDNSRNAGDASPLKKYNVRTKLAIDAGPNVAITLAYNRAYVSSNLGLLYPPLEYATITGNIVANRLGTASYDFPSYSITKTDQVTAKIEVDTGVGTLTSYTGKTWQKFLLSFDYDATYLPISGFRGNTRQHDFQQAVDFAIDAIDNVGLVIGGYYQKSTFGSSGQGSLFFNPPPALPAVAIFRELGTKAWAAYADANIHVSDRLTLGAGGRYSHDRRTTFRLFNLTATGTPAGPAATAKADWGRFTPRATIRYEIAPGTNIYANYSKGFRSGSFNATTTGGTSDQTPIEPEDINAYEVGLKTAQSNFRFEIAGYYYDYTNLNVALTVPNGTRGCAQTVCTLVGNAPKAEVYGVDAQVVFTPVESFNLTVGGAWIHARFGKFPNAVGTGLNIATGVNIPGQTQDFTGTDLSRAPKFSGTIAADYTADLGASGKLVFAGNLSLTSSYVLGAPSLFGPLAGDLARKERYREGGYALLNASIDWTDASEHLTVGLFGTNLTDTTYRINYGSLGTPGDIAVSGQPLSYGVRVGYRY